MRTLRTYLHNSKPYRFSFFVCSLSTHEINPIIGSWYVKFLKLKRNSALALSFVRQDGRRAERRIAPITRYLVFEEATSYVHTNVKTTTLTTLASFTYLENTRRKFLLSFLLWDLFYNNLHAYSKKFSFRDFVILLALVVEEKLHEWSRFQYATPMALPK